MEFIGYSYLPQKMEYSIEVFLERNYRLNTIKATERDVLACIALLWDDVAIWHNYVKVHSVWTTRRGEKVCLYSRDLSQNLLKKDKRTALDEEVVSGVLDLDTWSN